MTFIDYSYLNTDLIIEGSTAPERLQRLLEVEGLLVLDSTPARLVFEVVSSSPEADVVALATALFATNEALRGTPEAWGKVTFDIGFSASDDSPTPVPPMEATLSRAALQAVARVFGQLRVTIYPTTDTAPSKPKPKSKSKSKSKSTGLPALWVKPLPLRDLLLSAPEHHLDESMRARICTWPDDPTPLQILEVLDLCIHGSLASGVTVALLQASYDSICKTAGTNHAEVVKGALWRPEEDRVP